MEPPRRTRRYARRLTPTERREQLLDVALALVVESGYGALSMHAIARRADVTRPVVYDSFANKDDLISALVDREESRMLGSLAALAPAIPSADPTQLLVDVFTGFLLAVKQNPATWRLVYTPPEGTPEILRNHIAVNRARVRVLLEPLLATIAHSRDLTTDIELAAHLAQSIGEMCARLILTDPDRYPPERLTTFITQLLFPAPGPGDKPVR